MPSAAVLVYLAINTFLTCRLTPLSVISGVTGYIKFSMAASATGARARASARHVCQRH